MPCRRNKNLDIQRPGHDYNDIGQYVKVLGSKHAGGGTKKD